MLGQRLFSRTIAQTGRITWRLETGRCLPLLVSGDELVILLASSSLAPLLRPSLVPSPSRAPSIGRVAYGGLPLSVSPSATLLGHAHPLGSPFGTQVA